ncbi:recombination-associated protein RdgC [Marinicellulosiphila megalodicopiae]|uniref:recombination-associated protein RdgC n=1 Tax=Marinicellulosiphila megalodicopiae TaxID=2724896 RepID=UPI003BB1BC19
MFRNAVSYSFNENFTLTIDQIENALSTKPKRSLSSQEIESWAAEEFIKGDDRYCLDATNGFILFKFNIQTRVLPAQVVNKAVNDKIEIIKEKEQRNISKKERAEIKENILFELIPRSFIKEKCVNCMVSTNDRRLIVDTQSFAMADEITSLLRSCLGSLAITPLSALYHIPETITQWRNKPPADIELLEEFQLISSLDRTIKVNHKNTSLYSNQVNEHIEEGMILKYVRMSFDEKIEFTLDDLFLLRKIKFAVEPENKTEDEYENIQSQAFLESKELNLLLDKIIANISSIPNRA